MSTTTPEAPTSVSGPQPDAAKKSDGDLIKAAANGKLKDNEVHDALGVYLRKEGEAPPEGGEPKPLKLNVGTDDKPLFIRWVIQPVEDSDITKARESSQSGNRAQRRAGESTTDETLVARKIVAKGTVEPSAKALTEATGLIDVNDALYAYFKRFGKTGLITQISGAILSISGWDEDDVQSMEVEAVQG
jgi:hypothetical protein